MAISKRTWATLLFVVVAAVAGIAVVQQATMAGRSGGSPVASMMALAISMAFPVGMAWWGKKTGQVGPAIGALSLIALLWTALVLGG